ncbi:hypothetical protein CABS01_14109 [Colletotrichum abscissum]|uniref:uncharacterized protein n=1 Tax=Colletotrichum abscissum TaxID=1671311 RepID=UPI0027D6BE5F|nr:uncharacterized protein CABS01_14109 [Colletotrichum abscissum]KAK1481911.1 hypothetical protein CABS01_14109 [Colletotrichum abscissum]
MSSLALPMKHTEVVLPMYTTYAYSAQFGKPEHAISLAKRCFETLKTPQPAPTHDLMTPQSCCTPYGPRLVAGFHPAPTGTSRSMTSGDNMVRTAVTYDNRSCKKSLCL